MLLCIFPTLLTGTHSKKQGEDLSDNDGDEDEGILFGDERQLHVLDLFIVFPLYIECSPPFCIFYLLSWSKESSKSLYGCGGCGVSRILRYFVIQGDCQE